ncbi:uncharacterized protein CTRU02_209146 [Colletotrichum truncatum]|uniref:Uncharacterized protein n=1 Tax=Colletotrichum truncatum TaxID=5467 RepID=A0ACC3YYC6_COLTU|nr:uncharacterized protein CTRU02_14546 [Colletotrichum truncatum]KAF6782102.1 hypothetical protein CTRU02_14546 [Colletotrichum truncatum]
MDSQTPLRTYMKVFAAVSFVTAAITPKPVGPAHLDLPPTLQATAITWTACPTDVKPFKGNNDTQAVQCANFSVPINYNDANGASVNLGIVKFPAAGKRIGNLFLNPGGPGGSAANTVLRVASKKFYISDAIRQNFDIIGMDPRGVGLSSPQKCDTNLLNQLSDFDATTPEGFEKLFNYNKAVGESCRALTGPLFDNMDTTLVARDLEAVRVAAGNEPMNYLGFSYGTQLGAQYAALFPTAIRAMALDGILHHAGTSATNIVTEAASLDSTIQAFFRFCEANSSNCGEGGQDIRQTWNKVIEVAKAGKLKAAECDGTPKTLCLTDATVSDVIGTTRSVLGNPIDRKDLAEQLRLAMAGNGSLLTAELLSGDPFTDSSVVAITNVLCQDGTFFAAKDHTEVQLVADMTRTFTVTPGVGEFWKRVIDCTGYPVKISNPPAALSIKGMQNPALLVQSRFDPATSIVFAAGMAREFQNATMVLREGSGHTSYKLGGDASRVIDDYLINLKVPPPGTVVQS